MADLANIAVAGADVAVAIANPEGQEVERKFNICDWNNLNCCEVYHRINLIVASLFLVASAGGAIAAWSGVAIIQIVAIVYAIWGTYVGILGIVYTVKYLELGGMVHQTNRLKTEVNDLEGEVNELETTNNSLVTQVEALKNTNNQIRTQMGVLENTNKELKVQLEKLNTQIVEFDRLIDQFSVNFKIHDKTLLQTMEGMNKTSKNLEERLKKIESVFELATNAQKDSARQLIYLKGSVAMLGRGVTNLDEITKEQKILTDRETKQQEKMDSMLKRQETLTKELEDITRRFDKARPIVLSLAAQLLFYKREYQRLKKQ